MIWKAVYVLPVPVATTSRMRLLPLAMGLDRGVERVELVVTRGLAAAFSNNPEARSGRRRHPSTRHSAEIGRWEYAERQVRLDDCGKPTLAASAAGRLNFNSDDASHFAKRLTSLKLPADGHCSSAAVCRITGEKRLSPLRQSEFTDL